MYYDLFLPGTANYENTASGIIVDAGGKKATVYAVVALPGALHCLCTESQMAALKAAGMSAYDFSTADVAIKTKTGGPCHTFGHNSNGVKWLDGSTTYKQCPNEKNPVDITNIGILPA